MPQCSRVFEISRGVLRLARSRNTHAKREFPRHPTLLSEKKTGKVMRSTQQQKKKKKKKKKKKWEELGKEGKRSRAALWKCEINSLSLSSVSCIFFFEISTWKTSRNSEFFSHTLSHSAFTTLCSLLFFQRRAVEKKGFQVWKSRLFSSNGTLVSHQNYFRGRSRKVGRVFEKSWNLKYVLDFLDFNGTRWSTRIST